MESEVLEYNDELVSEVLVVDRMVYEVEIMEALSGVDVVGTLSVELVTMLELVGVVLVLDDVVLELDNVVEDSLEVTKDVDVSGAEDVVQSWYTVIEEPDSVKMLEQPGVDVTDDGQYVVNTTL